MDIVILKDLIADLAVVNDSLKEGKFEAERGVIRALSDDFGWSDDKIIEELGNTATAACYEFDTARDSISAIIGELEDVIDQAEYNEVVWDAVKNF